MMYNVVREANEIAIPKDSNNSMVNNVCKTKSLNAVRLSPLHLLGQIIR